MKPGGAGGIPAQGTGGSDVSVQTWPLGSSTPDPQSLGPQALNPHTLGPWALGPWAWVHGP